MQKLSKLLMTAGLVLGLATPALAHPGPSSIRVESQRQHYVSHDRYEGRYENRHKKRHHYREQQREHRFSGYDYQRGYDDSWARHAKRHDGKHEQKHHRYHDYGHASRHDAKQVVHVLPRGSRVVVVGGKLYHRWGDRYFLSGYDNGQKVYFDVKLRF